MVLASLLWICLLIPTATLAENLHIWSEAGSPQVNSAVVFDNTLYLMTNQGLFAYSLKENQMKCLFSSSALSDKGISTDSLLCGDQQLILFDSRTHQIWKYENERFEAMATIDFSNAEALQAATHFSFIEIFSGQFYAFVSDENGNKLGLMRVNVASGAATLLSPRGVIQLLKDADGQMLAVREKNEGNGTTHEIVQIDPETLSVQKKHRTGR